MLKSFKDLQQPAQDSSEVYLKSSHFYCCTRLDSLKNLCLADFAARIIRQTADSKNRITICNQMAKQCKGIQDNNKADSPLCQV